MHPLWWLAWSLLLLLVWAFARIALDRADTRRRRDSEEAAEEVLRRRFAGGDIDEDEFERLHTLRETHAGR